MRAFITGSRVYGTPREDSDLDLVVLCDDQAHELLHLHGADGALYAPVRFANLNIIVLRDPAQFEAWRKTTENLKARAPVTREEACEAIKLACAEALGVFQL